LTISRPPSCAKSLEAKPQRGERVGWKPLHSDERIEHERRRQSLKGRAQRYLRFVRYHPWPALRAIIGPLIVAALLVVLVVAAV
jgi:hypothetical protein